MLVGCVLGEVVVVVVVGDWPSGFGLLPFVVFYFFVFVGWFVVVLFFVVRCCCSLSLS